MATKEDIELSLMCSLHPNVLFVIRSTETRFPLTVRLKLFSYTFILFYSVSRKPRSDVAFSPNWETSFFVIFCRNVNLSVMSFLRLEFSYLPCGLK